MGDELRDLSLEFGRVRESGRCHLDQDNFADPLRVIVQQLFKGTKLGKKSQIQGQNITTYDTTYLLNDTLDDVQFVTSDNDLLTFVKRTQCLEFGLNAWTQTIARVNIRKNLNLPIAYTSRPTRSASIPTGQCIIAETWPSTSMPLELISYPHTLTHVDVK